MPTLQETEQSTATSTPSKESYETSSAEWAAIISARADQNEQKAIDDYNDAMSGVAKDRRRAEEIDKHGKRFDSEEEYALSYYSPKAQTLRARKVFYSFGKRRRYRNRKATYHQAFTVFRAIVGAWRRKDCPEDGIALSYAQLEQLCAPPKKKPKLPAIAGQPPSEDHPTKKRQKKTPLIKERRIRELLELCAGRTMYKNGKDYEAPFPRDGQPFLTVIPGKGRENNRYIPHLP